MPDAVAPAGACGSRVYVADYARNDVEIFPASNVSNPKPCGKLVTGIQLPLAVYVDNKGTVYVSDYSGPNGNNPPYPINVFPKGKHTPSLTIDAAGPGYDLFVGKGRILYVAEATQSAVAEYAPGSTTPRATLSINGEPYGVATDQNNNLYVSYLSNADGMGHVEKFAPGATTGTNLPLTVSLGGEVRLDTADDVVIGDRNNNIIDIFAPGQTTPSRSWSTAAKPSYIALNHAETYLYTTGFGSVQIFDYATGTQVGAISNHLISASGVAVYPPAPF
ncbi:MAG TPA: hypothetical protein VGZ02_09480 [Candidatus Baltobacteraceae bacterium]|nr:hypothetical protein [Candidatus Baltobacteraceae bacterium]